MSDTVPEPIVRYVDETAPIDCPYGTVQRVITGGDAPANMHLVRVSRGGEHYHLAYDEIYYVTSGIGQIHMGGRDYDLRPGAVAYIPAGLSHSLEAAEGDTLEFMIVGIPGVPIDSDEARPRKS